ncbi:nucleoside triphosphate pyrophosphohydrolase [Treponema parvum]|uniref:Nucleoside triphosphate pyrophosphohydrolase n=1 Tax=Treponema parvum TaxID=138851 RepID=A0A975IDY7_9SPIR|nr:nucleoside triphosphate pyrophosphohydrolase [Treponema parvum]QTQ13396.1 nucleoside triphosphate pyrophosphohydrolase [Treponema parvum]
MKDAPQINKKIQKEAVEAASYKRLSDTVKCLRDKDGCPWDIKQTPLSMRTDLAEETFEAIDAISEQDTEHAKEELGDVFLNAVMIAYMYEQEGSFTVADVLDAVTEKIIRRHPHVFKTSSGSTCVTKTPDTPEEVLVQWDSIKESIEGRKSEKSILDQIPKGFPPLLKAYKMQKKAAKKGFDWDSPHSVLKKVKEELEEVLEAQKSVLKARAAFKEGDKPLTIASTPQADKAQLNLEEEVGDLLFSVVNYSRHLGVDPFIALSRTNEKFYKRFSFVEQKMKESNMEMDPSRLKEMDRFWDEAKAQDL